MNKEYITELLDTIKTEILDELSYNYEAQDLDYIEDILEKVMDNHTAKL